MKEKDESGLWPRTGSALLIAVVAAALSGWLASRDTRAQIDAAFQAQDREVTAGQSAADLTLRRQVIDAYFAAERLLYRQVAAAFEAAGNVAVGAVPLEHSPLVTEFKWNPAGFRMSTDDLPAGRDYIAEEARVALFFDRAVGDCVDRLSQLSRVLLWEASHLATDGTLEWFANKNLAMEDSDYVDFLNQFSMLRGQLIDRFVAVAKSRVALGDKPPIDSCSGMATHFRGSSTKCSRHPDFYLGEDTCKDLTLEQLRA